MSHTEKLGACGLAKMTHGLTLLTEIVLVTPGCEGAAAAGAAPLHAREGPRLILGSLYCGPNLSSDARHIRTATLHQTCYRSLQEKI